MAVTAQKNQKSNSRRAGILLHPTSFPSRYGIGDLGNEAYRFIDFLASSGARLWQVLPLGPTGYGDSPYQAFSSFAGQPLIISPDKLIEMGLLTEADVSDVPNFDPHRIDYGPAIIYKFNLLRKAYEHFKQIQTGPIRDAYTDFCLKEQNWLQDYALFMATKDAHGGMVWTRWEQEIAFPTETSKEKWREKLIDDVEFYQFIQFIFFKQWDELKMYANAKDILIIGDIPIFVAFDSADVWANKHLFMLDKDGNPALVAGVPPDYFSETGQLWGNPQYDWEKHEADGFSWWIERIGSTLRLVDFLRIDHFRGFESYWAIPYGSPNAINGKWLKGPDKKLFLALKKGLGDYLPIIAEDLGIITEEVEALRDAFGFPGMKVLQFAFEDLKDNDFLPHNYTANSICYTGTHDNDTSLGWYNSASPACQDRLRRYMNTDARDVAWDFIRTCISSVSNMAVVPLQDVLSLDSSARMNTPGTPSGNWQWRYTPEMLNSYISERFRSICELYGRTGTTDND